MKKTITFPVGYRPAYLLQFLNSLAEQDLEDYEIICSAERSPACIKVLEEHSLPITILLKPNSSGARSHSGARDNMFNVLNYAFKEAGSDFNVHLEDDFLLSPDAINLASWYCENYKDDPYAFTSYGLFNWGSRGNDYKGLVTAPTFHGLGWCAFKENWDECYAKSWYDDELARKYADAYGWDWAVEAFFKEYKRKSILPMISRTKHIGRFEGTCCTVEFYDKTYPSLHWNNSVKETEFELRDVVEETHIH